MQKHQCKIIYAAGIIVVMMALLSLISKVTAPQMLVDTHEHIESFEKAQMLMEASEKTGVKKTVLVASPIETLSLNGSKSFTGYKENMDEIFRIADTYPKKFIPFCTVSPMDPGVMEYLQECLNRGAKGLKLYNGHSYYHDIFGLPLDSPRMMPVYAFAERNQMPILFHVNIVKYQNELETVLKKNPGLLVSIPHFMVSSVDISKVEDLMDRYPNLYTDISFGSTEFLAAGFRRISKDPGKYAGFINDYQDRVLFGADMVLTGAQEKDVMFMEERINCYKDLLQKRKFSCGPVVSFYEGKLNAYQESYDNCKPKEGAYCESIKSKLEVYQKRFDESVKLNGLGLSNSVLKKIYEDNAMRYLSGEPAQI